jgi:hypothetical protein
MFGLIPERYFEEILAEVKKVRRKSGRIVSANMTKGQRGSAGTNRPLRRRIMVLSAWTLAADFAEPG